MSAKRKHSPEPGEGKHLFRSPPIEDRSSTFIGIFSPSLKHKDLQKLDEIASASHKMVAWRRESNQQAITGGTKYTTDSDDDGEKYGGKKIAKVLDGMQAIGSCVVARWYGGVMLGPVRFDHIERCAREAVQKWKDAMAEEHTKKRKVAEDEAMTKKLVAVLAERDQSIVVLRALALEKEEKVKKAKESDQDAVQPEQSTPTADAGLKEKRETVQPAIDYTTMPLERLKALERARDATLAFLLKRIDKAEVELVGVTGQIPDD